jgi:hypothetical protein
MINTPTDSLYKFCAIGGIVLILFTGNIIADKIMNINKEIFELEKSMAISRIEIKWITKDTDKLGEEVKSGELKSTTEEAKEIELNLKKHEIQTEIFLVTTNHIKTNIRFFYILIAFGSIFIAIGLYMTFWGFKIWHLVEGNKLVKEI